MLTQLYWSAVREYNLLATRQMRFVVLSGGSPEPEKLAELQERTEQARSALLAHLSWHGCAGAD